MGVTIKASSLIGFHTIESARKAGLLEYPKKPKNNLESPKEPKNNFNIFNLKDLKKVKGHNRCLFIGYVPVIGLVAGVTHIRTAVSVSKTDEKIDKNKFILSPQARALLFIRGVCECLGIGILFLIPDIIALIARYRDKKKAV